MDATPAGGTRDTDDGASVVGPQVSGLYERDAVPGGRGKEELRLDVDARYPQMMASGTIRRPPAVTLAWVATLRAVGEDTWRGPIIFERSPEAAFPWTRAEVKVSRNEDPDQQTAQLRLIRPGGQARTSSLTYRSPHFRPLNLEFDWEGGEVTTLSLDTCAHSNRPASLPCETLTVEQVFERAGFDVSTTAGGAVPRRDAGADRLWSDQEMHDAMQDYWTHFSTQARWAIWVFFASLHEPLDGPPEDLGGIMFDSIGRHHRQGTAVFTDSFISVPPPRDPNPAAAVKRMLFWTACHEMGHCFNLAHSWDKTAGRTWIPLRDEPEVRSFMNYPFVVRGGERAFFKTFKYRFSGQELQFLRHAPARFVKPGAAAWFDHHAFEALEDATDPSLALEVRVNRERPHFEFMEPILVELKLTNVADDPQIVDEWLLRRAGAITAIVKHDRHEAREVVPFAHHCWKPKRVVLEPGRSMYAPMLMSTGQNGWDLSEPGHYSVQVGVHHDGLNVVSNELRLRVAPPSSREEEALASDFFTDDVGRAISFTGTASLTGANDTLRETVERLPDSRVARHARLALGNVAARDYKRLRVSEGTGDERLAITTEPAEEEGYRLIEAALIEDPQGAAESFGHLGYRGAVERYSDLLVRHDAQERAVGALDTLLDTLASRTVRGRPVLTEALEAIESRRQTLGQDG